MLIPQCGHVDSCIRCIVMLSRRQIFSAYNMRMSRSKRLTRTKKGKRPETAKEAKVEKITNLKNSDLALDEVDDGRAKKRAAAERRKRALKRKKETSESGVGVKGDVNSFVVDLGAPECDQPSSVTLKPATVQPIPTSPLGSLKKKVAFSEDIESSPKSSKPSSPLKPILKVTGEISDTTLTNKLQFLTPGVIVQASSGAESLQVIETIVEQLKVNDNPRKFELYALLNPLLARNQLTDLKPLLLKHLKDLVQCVIRDISTKEANAFNSRIISQGLKVYCYIASKYPLVCQLEMGSTTQVFHVVCELLQLSDLKAIHLACLHLLRTQKILESQNLPQAKLIASGYVLPRKVLLATPSVELVVLSLLHCKEFDSKTVMVEKIAVMEILLRHASAEVLTKFIKLWCQVIFLTLFSCTKFNSLTDKTILSVCDLLQETRHALETKDNAKFNIYCYLCNPDNTALLSQDTDFPAGSLAPIDYLTSYLEFLVENERQQQAETIWKAVTVLINHNLKNFCLEKWDKIDKWVGIFHYKTDYGFWKYLIELTTTNLVKNPNQASFDLLNLLASENLNVPIINGFCVQFFKQWLHDSSKSVVYISTLKQLITNELDCLAFQQAIQRNGHPGSLLASQLSAMASIVRAKSEPGTYVSVVDSLISKLNRRDMTLQVESLLNQVLSTVAGYSTAVNNILTNYLQLVPVEARTCELLKFMADHFAGNCVNKLRAMVNVAMSKQLKLYQTLLLYLPLEHALAQYVFNNLLSRLFPVKDFRNYDYENMCGIISILAQRGFEVLKILHNVLAQVPVKLQAVKLLELHRVPLDQFGVILEDFVGRGWNDCAAELAGLFFDVDPLFYTTAEAAVRQLLTEQQVLEKLENQGKSQELHLYIVDQDKRAEEKITYLNNLPGSSEEVLEAEVQDLTDDEEFFDASSEAIDLPKVWPKNKIYDNQETGNSSKRRKIQDTLRLNRSVETIDSELNYIIKQDLSLEERFKLQTRILEFVVKLANPH